MNSLASPQNFKRRILLLVSGMSPQIATEFFFALTKTLIPSLFYDVLRRLRR
ncbi:MAG: hypothetical protein HKM02_08120 [Pseudomonadales bacterium]|nr:hypothetical protein [Pseudomonadales bacterium]